MYKTSIGLILVFISSLSFAQEMTCLDKLLPFNRHSGLHQVNNDEWSDGKDALDSEGTEKVIKFLIHSKLLCKPGEVVIKVSPVCTSIITDLPQSNTCFVFSNLGYFVVSRDNVRNVNFIFTRDRRFSEK